MTHRKRICLFCGARTGKDKAYLGMANQMGTILTEMGYGIVYGGASIGLMGAIADAALANGGEVTGIIPASMRDKELAHTNLTKLHVVQSMHERKALMAQISDGFIALPGGIGTLDEFCEMLTWAQLEHHDKPIGILNFGGLFTPFIEFLHKAESEGLMETSTLKKVIVHDSPAGIAEKFKDKLSD